MFLNRWIIEKFLKKYLAQLIYMIAVPFYMVEFSLMMLYSHTGKESALWYLTPLFLGTVWIPAVFSLGINLFCRRLFQEPVSRKWERNYPAVFIFMYAIYFFILSKISFASYCLAASLFGLVLGFFLLLLKRAQKQMCYLPPEKEFWFYVLTFLPPIVILFFTDIYYLIAKESPYFILMAPVSYLPEIMGFFCYTVIRKVTKKRLKITLFEAVFVMQIFNMATSLYFGAYFGDKIIWIALSISLITARLAEYFSRFRAFNRPQDEAMPKYKAE